MATGDRPGPRRGAKNADKAGPRSGDSIRDFVAETIADKLAGKAEHLERHAARAAKKAETLDRLAAHLSALDVWTRVEPVARRPRFTREDLAAAAMHIADTEGFGAVSMRRIATELDAGTMTLYHYIRTKDELLTLVTDAVMGEVIIAPDEEMPANWRDAVSLIANRSRAALERHLWILDLIDDPPIGPNSVRHFDQSIQAVSSLSISIAEKLDIVTMVDEYVFGYCLQARNNVQQAEAGIDSEMIAYVNDLIDTGDYPYLRALADDIGLEAAWTQIEEHQRDPGRFDRNLARLLDGIEASLPTT